MKVLAGGPARETESDLFRLHKNSLALQQGGFSVGVRHDVCPDPGGNRWDSEKMDRVARVRQTFMDEARASGAALLMVDTDVVLSRYVLERLWQVEADVVYGVFWTNWPGFDDPQPQVWDYHYFGHTPSFRGWMRAWKAERGPVAEREVLGGGACTLIRGRGFESRYWPRLESLARIPGQHMWGGEDRSFCIGLECRDIRQVAVFGLPISHMDKPRLQTPEALDKIKRTYEL